MNRRVHLPAILGALIARTRLRRDQEAGFTLVEVIMGVAVLGIIMVPLGMAVAVGFRATLRTEQRLAAAQDAQAVSAYFPADVQSVDATGFNPIDSVNRDVCPADPTATTEEVPLALFVWNQDLGVNGQTVARYIARGKGRDSELVRRYCNTTTAPALDVVLARNFGEGDETPAADYFTDPGAVNPARPETPSCGSRTCTLLIHGAFDYRLDANRRVDGEANNNTVPGKPTNVHATGGNQRATIYWDVPIDDGGAPIEAYYVQNVQTGAITGPYNTPDGTPAGAGQPGLLGVTIEGLTNGQSYTFKVRALNPLGPGAFSAPSTAVTPGPTVPDPPTIGTATADPAVAGKASVTWSLVPGYDNGGSALTGFRVYAQNQPNPPVVVDTPGGTATSGVVSGLVDNTRYQLLVGALNTFGESSPSAASNQILTLPGQPGTPTAESTGTTGTVKITFTPPSGGDFTDLTNLRAHIVETNTYTSPVSAAAACPNATAGDCELTVPGLVSGQIYTVRVQAQNSTGWGVESDPTTGIDVTDPAVTLTSPSNNAVLATSTPTFGGAAGTSSADLPTVTVRIYAGSTAGGPVLQTRTATASSGSWTIGATTLADGTYTAQASQTDTFGNVGRSGTRTFSVDTTGPTVTIATPADNSATNSLTPTFTGSAGNATGPYPAADSATVTVKVYSGTTTTGSPVQTRTATRSGTAWSIAASPSLAQGTYTVQATQTDALGNVGTSPANTFAIDTSAPTVTISDPTAGSATKDATPTLAGTAGNAGAPNADSSTVTVRIYTGATTGGTLTQTLSAPRTGTSWTIDAATLASGQFTAQATQTDSAGNTGTSTTVTFVVDTTAPAVTLTAPANNTASTNFTPTFSGAAGNAAGPSPSADSTTVTVRIYSGTTTGGTLVQTRNATRSGTAWTIAASPALAEGTYTAQASQTDAAGNTGTSSANTFAIDTTSPTVEITSPADNSAVNTTTPTFTGTAGNQGAPNADSATVTVRIYAGSLPTGTVLQTRAATRTGTSWSIAASPALAVGTYTAQATQTDSAGNTGTSVANTFTIDTTGPTVTITSPGAGSALNDTTPTFAGAAGNQSTPVADSPTVTVRIYAGATTGGTLTQTLPATRTGASWSINAAALANGQFTAQATQTDAAGNTGTSTAVTFVIDTTAPTVTVTAPADGSVTNSTTPTFSGTAGSAAGPSPSADSASVVVRIYSGSTATGSPVQTRTATRSGAAWTVAASPALSAGTYTVQATQTDAAGNIGTSNDNTFLIDTTSPSVSITNPSAGAATNDNTPTFTGTAGNQGAPNPDSATVTVKIYTGATTGGTLTQTLTATRTGTAWTVTGGTALANGQFTAQATQTDTAGNTGASTAVTFVVDTTAPAVTVTAPASSSATNDTTPTFTGTAGSAVGPSPSADSATVTVKVYSGSTVTGSPVQTLSATRSGTNWSVTPGTAFSTGTYTVRATQTDAAGNTGTSNDNTFVIDTTAPSVTITAPADNNVSNVTTPTFTGTAGNQGGLNADSATVTVRVYSGTTTGGALVQTRTATRSGTSWSVAASPALASGTYTVQATQTDAAGNTGTSNDNTFVIDTTAPTVTITAPTAAQATNDNTPTISGTAGNQGAPNADSATVTVRIYNGATTGGTLNQTRTATRSGTAWSTTATTLTAGQYTVQATQTDSIGNTGTSTAITFVVDTTSPTVTLTAPTANQVFGTDTNQAVTFSGAAGNASGPSPSADSLSVTATVYSGSTTGGSVVQTRTATRSSASSTAWSVATGSNLGYGTYTVQATQTDAAGNTGSSSAVTFQVVPRRVRVSSTSGSSSGNGTASSPMNTVTNGIAKAVSLGWPQVDLQQGTYNEGIAGVALVDNINISGGWDSGFTAQSGANTLTVIQGGQQAAFGDGDTGITLSRLMLSASGASATDRNVYGLRAINSSTVTLTNVRVVAAAAFAGTAGTVGTTGAGGGAGVNGPNGANNSNAGPSGGAGGSGGAPNNGGNGGGGGQYNTNGVAGSGATGGGGGGTAGPKGSSSSSCTSGSDGGTGTGGSNSAATGAGGSAGAGALASGTAAATWSGPSGGSAAVGGNGTSAGGGGGGGGSSSGCTSANRSSGGAGGGGGEAGTGGNGGTGGTYGGGSFGVYTLNSSVTLDSASSVVAGAGGDGGAGGLGGGGGTGGNGGNGGTGGTRGGDGGKGGKGGNGAAGGRGGGGPGGPSVALFDKGTGSITQGGASLSVGAGGAGGAGGNTGGTGVSQTIANL